MSPRFVPRQIRAGVVLVLCAAGAAMYLTTVDRVYPIRDWLFWNLLTLWSWCALFNLGCLAFGELLLTRCMGIRGLPTGERLVCGMATGLVAFTLAMYLAGVLGLYGPAWAIALPTAMIAAGGPGLAKIAVSLRAQVPRAPGTGATPWRVAATVGAVLCVALVYLQCMTPAAINYDARWYHLTVAQDYAREGRIVPFFGDYNKAAFPQLASLAHTWDYLVPGLDPPLRWMLIMHQEFCIFAWTLAGVGAAAAWLVGQARLKGSWAAFFLFPIIFVYDSNLGGAADHYVGFFAAPLFLATVRAGQTLSVRRCILAGVFLAGAFLTKYQAIYFLAPVTGIVLGRWLWLMMKSGGERPRDQLWVGPVALAVIAALITSPHFLKNWIYYGNPVFPFMTDAFPGTRPRVPNSAVLVRQILTYEPLRPQGPFFKKLKDAVRIAFTFSLQPHYTFTKNFPAMGSVFTFLLPVIPFVNRQKRIWLGAFFGLAALVTWSFTCPVDRYVQSFLPILAAVAAAMIVRVWELGLLPRIGLMALLGTQIVWGGDVIFYEGHARLADSIEMIRSGFDGTAKTRFAKYFSEQIALDRRLPKGAVVLFHNSRLSLGVNRKVLQDLTGFQGLFTYDGVKTPRDVYELYKSQRITHIVHERGVWPAFSKQEEVMFAAFIRKYGENIFTEGGYEIIEMPRAPPPVESEYEVLFLGHAGYSDGVYPAHALNTCEPMPEHNKQWARPTLPVAGDAAAAPAILDRVAAVVVATTYSMSPAVDAAVREHFESVVSYSGQFSVYLSRR